MFETTFDDQVREIANDRAEVLATLDTLAVEQQRVQTRIDQALDPVAIHDRAKLMTRRADGFRFIGMWRESRDLYTDLIAFWDREDRARASMLARLKRALVIFEIDPEIDPFPAIDADWSDQFSPYRPFFCEYRARYHFARGAWDDAERDLQAALAIRQQIGSPKPIEHTLSWLKTIEQRRG